MTGLLFALSFTPRVQASASLTSAFWVVAGLLLLWILFLWRQRGVFELHWHTVKAHYVQACVQLGVYAYWGYYWRPVYDQALLIISQVVFAYAFDMLLAWSRRRTWTLGFGHFPIIFSTNLFLWFKDDWFALQFVMVAIGILGKEFIRWRRDGKLSHIFNPSGFSLTVVSLALIFSGSSGITWGEEVATTLAYPPRIYLVIFALGLVVQFFFSVTLMTVAAAAMLWLLNTVYLQVTGVYFFIDSNIPVAVFLGLHLLVTDPATSPRTEFGRVLFGAFYGALVFGLFAVLTYNGVPTYYDKLLCVPLLNLSVRGIDGFVRQFAATLPRFDTMGLKLAQPTRNLIHMGIWIAVFCGMFSTEFVGAHHQGGTVKFWRDACREGRRNGCRNLVLALQSKCDADLGWAHTELGTLLEAGEIVPKNIDAAREHYMEAARLGDPLGSILLATHYLEPDGDALESGFRRALPTLRSSCEEGDGLACYLLGLAYSRGRGIENDSVLALELFDQACTAGWTEGCVELGRMYLSGTGTAPDLTKGVAALERACEQGHAGSCLLLAGLYHEGRGVNRDDEKARTFLERACKLGNETACEALRHSH